MGFYCECKCNPETVQLKKKDYTKPCPQRTENGHQEGGAEGGEERDGRKGWKTSRKEGHRESEWPLEVSGRTYGAASWSKQERTPSVESPILPTGLETSGKTHSLCLPLSFSACQGGMRMTPLSNRTVRTTRQIA